jgi:hypothetical protein
MVYSVGAVERAMTIHQALLHALHGRQTWFQVADVIGLTRRALAMARPIPGFPTPGLSSHEAWSYADVFRLGLGRMGGSGS